MLCEYGSPIIEAMHPPRSQLAARIEVLGTLLCAMACWWVFISYVGMYTRTHV
jgi:hypothetical protein